MRALAALTTDVGGYGGLTKAPIPDLDIAWKQLQVGIEHTLSLLDSNGGITASKLLASNTSLIPIVTFLGLNTGKKLTAEDADALIYWIVAVGISLRYSAGKETRLAEDLAAVHGPDPVRSLLARAGLLRREVIVSPEDLEGRTVTSPYFALSYLAARGAGATDWFHGLALGTAGKGRFALEYHHIHPKKTLTGYTRHQVNDLANYAFISKKANSKISARSPERYFEDLEHEDLATHFVPMDAPLRTADRYPDFLVARRALLAAAMTRWIGDFRPSYVRVDGAPPRPLGTRVELQVYRFDRESDDDVPFDCLLVSIDSPGGDGYTILAMDQLRRAIEDADNGLIPTMTIGETVIDLSDAESPDQLGVPTGPLRLVGTTAEWRQVLDREEAEVRSLAQVVKDIKGRSSLKAVDSVEMDYFVLDTD